jgi:hypothetical protein
MFVITVMMIVLSMTRMVGISSAATTTWVAKAPRPCPRRSRGSQACRLWTSGAERGERRAVFECLRLAVRAVRLSSTAPRRVCAVGIVSIKGSFWSGVQSFQRTGRLPCRWSDRVFNLSFKLLGVSAWNHQGRHADGSFGRRSKERGSYLRRSFRVRPLPLLNPGSVRAGTGSESFWASGHRFNVTVGDTSGAAVTVGIRMVRSKWYRAHCLRGSWSLSRRHIVAVVFLHRMARYLKVSGSSPTFPRAGNLKWRPSKHLVLPQDC